MPVTYALLTAVGASTRSRRPRRGSRQPLLTYPKRSHLWLARDSSQAGAGARPLIGLPGRRLPAAATSCGGVSS